MEIQSSSRGGNCGSLLPAQSENDSDRSKSPRRHGVSIVEWDVAQLAEEQRFKELKTPFRYAGVRELHT